MDDENGWPILDFDAFPNGMISGLTLSEINECMSIHNITPSLQEIDETFNSLEGCSTSFMSPVSDEQLSAAKRDNIPGGTLQRNNWSIALYIKWYRQRKNLPEEKFPLPSKEELLTVSTECIDYWLAKFIFELRKDDGTRYPRNSLISVIAGLNAFFKTHDRNVNLFADECFKHFRDILDVACKSSSRLIPNAPKRQAEVITHDEEEKMWMLDVLGSDTPEKLIHTLFFLNGLHFALRSGQEHRSLKVSQLKIIPPTPDCQYYSLEYVECVSKTNNGGLKSAKIEPKQVKHIDTNSIDTPCRSHVLLLKKYLERRPNDIDDFYLTPRKSLKNDNSWYKVSRISNTI